MKLSIVLTIVFSLFFLTSLQMAQDVKPICKSVDQSTSEETTHAENVGNKICPVMDESIDEESKVTYEHEGKIYNFCCAMCINAFKKEPAKYIKKVEKELQERQQS